MAIIHVNKNENYTVMHNHHLQNRNISLKAKGLMSQMLSLPSNWDYSIAGLAAINKDCETAIKSALAELKDAGYLVVTKKMPNETLSGRIEYAYDLYEEPQKQEGKKQEVENLSVEILSVENQGQYNTKEQNTKEQNTKDNISKGKPKKFDAIAFLDTVEFIRVNPDLKAAFISFLEMRESIKHPVKTEDGMKRLINEAYKCGNGDPAQMVACLNKSIIGSYRGIFPVHQDFPKNAPSPKKAQNGPKSAMDILDEMMAEELAKEANNA